MKRWLVTSVAAFVVPLACGSDTGRRRTTFEMDVAGIHASSTNTHGWNVVLTRAETTLGSVSFFEGEPLFSSLFRGWLAVPAAYAHPGHYMEGDALAELLEPKHFDLLAASPVVYGRAEGVTGDYNSAEVRVTSVALEGTATKDGTTVTFSAEVALDADVTGIAFGAPVENTDGKVELRIDLAKWLERADFSGVPDGRLEAETQPYRALLRGLVNTSSFVFERKEITP